MAHSPRCEAHLDAAWREFCATVDALQAELAAASPRARQKDLAAAARALRVKGLERLARVGGSRPARAA